MRQTTLFFLLLLSVAGLHAQDQSDPVIAKQIDEQVWEPFKKAYATLDGALYNSIHTDDVMRVTPWGIVPGPEYKARNLKNFARKDQPKRIIDFVFEHRIHSDTVSYEVGYYELTYEGKESHYGRFHVVLKKVEGSWKIAQDWDTGNVNGHEVGAADFERLKK